MDSFKKVDALVGEQIQTSLLQENFGSVQTFSSILALAAYLSLKATRLGDFTGLEAILSNDQAARYFMSPTCLINGRSHLDSRTRSL